MIIVAARLRARRELDRSRHVRVRRPLRLRSERRQEHVKEQTYLGNYEHLGNIARHIMQSTGMRMFDVHCASRGT